jgi:hypothetical protein
MSRSQHPSLPLVGPIALPGPLIPLLTIILPFAIQPRHYYIFRSLRLGPFLTILHILFYLSDFLAEYHTNAPQSDDITIPLLSYTTLVLGEAIHRTSTFWSYTSIAIGWVLICQEVPLSETLSPSTRAWMALLISVLSTLRTDEQLSTGAMVSALALFTRTIYHIWIVSSVSPVSGTAQFAMLLLLILARLGAVKLCGQLRKQMLVRRFLARLGNEIGRSAIGQCARCAEVAVAQISLLGAALIACAFTWSCFRWRWLWNVQSSSSRAPAWTVFSFFGGMLFLFPIYTLMLFLEHLPSGDVRADRGGFMERQVRNSLVAIWCTNCVYVVFWIMSEMLVALEPNGTLGLH